MSTSTASTVTHPAQTTAANETGVVGCLPAFDDIRADEVVTNSSEVQRYVTGVYEYDFSSESRASCTQSLPPLITLNVTGRQSVAGNWTTGYLITYSNNTLLRATVDVSFVVRNFSATSLQNRTYALTFSQDDIRVLEFTLSDPSVKSQIGGLDWYVSGIFPPVQSTNGTIQNEYYVTLDQVNGNRLVEIFANSQLTQVNGIYFSQVCRLNGWNGNFCA